MRFEWALKVMRAGHKVRSSRTPTIWLENNEFWYQTKRGVFNYTGITSNEILAEDWEIESVYDYQQDLKKGQKSEV